MLVVNAGTNLVLIPRQGGPGAAWATLLTELALTAVAWSFCGSHVSGRVELQQRHSACVPADGAPTMDRVPEPARAPTIDLAQRLRPTTTRSPRSPRQRYTENHILVRVRATFRRAVERYPAASMLDLGCGPGTDLAYFARLYPGRRYAGLDISSRMVEVARANLAAVPGARDRTRMRRGSAPFAGAASGSIWSIRSSVRSTPSRI